MKFDFDKAAEELYATPECQKAVADGIDKQFSDLLPAWCKPTPQELEDHRKEVLSRGHSPKELIFVYAKEFDKKLMDMQAKAFEDEVKDALYDGLEEFFSAEEIAEMKARHNK